MRHGAFSVLAGFSMLAPAASDASSDYSFDRWQIAPPSVTEASADVTPLVRLSPNKAESLSLPTNISKRSTDTDAHYLFEPDLQNLRLVSEGNLLGMMADDDVPKGISAGFTSGIDMGTVAFYSSGALLGVVGSNIGRDGKDDANGSSSDPTSYIYDPAIFVTDEFENNYGLGKIKAQFAYARGHTGDGVLVSVMDTRFNTDHSNLSGVFVTGYNVVDDNTVVNEDCTAAHNPCRHGTHVAGIIAGNKNDTDSSMHGVAYGARIKPVPFLEIGITTGAQQTNAFSHASGVDNGTGLQIVAMNNSWGPVAGFHTSTYGTKYFKVPNETTISSLNSIYVGSAAAADDDTILVFAAGNDGWNAETGVVDLYDSNSDNASPTGTALASTIAADSGAGISSANRIDTQTAMPTYAPDNTSYIIDEDENEYMWIVVVATDDNNTITDFSNACGVTKNYCLAAPGKEIFSTNGANSPAYVTLNGTSMATPHVTGAIAILADMYPNLLASPENITQILLETATDLGATGVDDIYGHGLLNLQDATGPLGSITITDSSFGASSITYGSAEVVTPIAFGDALSKDGLSIGGVDKYDRVFMLKLPVSVMENMQSRSVAGRAGSSLRAAPEAPKVELGSGFSFAPQPANSDGEISGAGISFTQDDEDHQLGIRFTTGMKPEAPVTTADAHTGYDRYFDAMAYATGTRERMTFDVGTTTPDGTRMTSSVRLDRDDDQMMTLISRSGYETYIGGVNLGLSLGGMTEEGRILGGEMTGALAVSSTHTLLARSQIILPLFGTGYITGYYEYARSMPTFTNESLVSTDGITSDSYGVSWKHNPRPNEQFAIVLHRPVAVTGGQLNINTVTGYTEGGDYFGETLGYRLAPSARETSLLAEYRRDIFRGGTIALGLNHRQNAQNVEGRENTAGFVRGEMQF